MITMTKTTFKKMWDKDDSNITFDDIAQCAIEWGLYKNPKTERIDIVANAVTKVAKCEYIYPIQDN